MKKRVFSLILCFSIGSGMTGIPVRGEENLFGAEETQLITEVCDKGITANPESDFAPDRVAGTEAAADKEETGTEAAAERGETSTEAAAERGKNSAEISAERGEDGGGILADGETCDGTGTENMAYGSGETEIETEMETEADTLTVVITEDSAEGGDGLQLLPSVEDSQDVYGELFENDPLIQEIREVEGELLTAEYFAAATSGTCGAEVKWVFQNDTLVISGKGTMTDYSSTNTAPWYELIDKIKTVRISSGVTSIGNYAFKDCFRLTSAEISDTVTTIGNYPFYNCTSLKSLNLNRVTRLSSTALGCTVLGSISVNPANTAFCSVDGVLFSKNKEKLVAYPAGKAAAYGIPEGTKQIGAYAFSGSTSLKSITFPSSVTKIGSYSFLNSGITDICLSGVKVIGSNGFKSCAFLEKVVFSAEIQEIGANAFANCSSLSRICFTGNVPSIADSAFSARNGRTVTYPKGDAWGWAKSGYLTNGKISGKWTGFTLGNCTISVPESSRVYTGNKNTPDFELIYEGYRIPLKYCTVTFSSNIKAGSTAKIVVKSTQYTGSKTASYQIQPLNLSGLKIKFSEDGTKDSFVYTGKPVTPLPILYGSTTSGGTKNYPDILPTDYKVTYSNNSKAGTAVITLTGTGNCTGTVSRSFAISKASITDMEVRLSYNTAVYNGGEQCPEVTVSKAGNLFSKGTDYTLAYSNNRNAGTASVQITGIGSVTGTRNLTFTISRKSIQNMAVSLSKKTYLNDGTEKKPAVTVTDGGKPLKQGTDFTVTYSNNVKVGTATAKITGIGNYAGTQTAAFEIRQNPKIVITAGNLSLKAKTTAQKVSLGAVTSAGTLTYTSGSSKVKVNSKGVVTIAANYYGISYITITGSANGYETVTKKVKVTVSRIPNTIKASDITLYASDKAQQASIQAKSFGNGTYAYSSSNPGITASSLGVLTVKAGFTGEADIRITVGKTGIYSASERTIHVTVNPAGTDLVSLTSPKKGKLKAVWIKNSDASGYEVQCSSKRSFKTIVKSRTLKKNTTTAWAFDSLKKGNTYYVRVRCYKTISGKNLYSKWSSIKKIKVN